MQSASCAALALTQLLKADNLKKVSKRAKRIIAFVMVFWPLWGAYVFWACYQLGQQGTIVNIVNAILIPAILFLAYFGSKVYKSKYGDSKVLDEAVFSLCLMSFTYFQNMLFFSSTFEGPPSRSFIIARTVVFIFFGGLMAFSYIMLVLSLFKHFKEPSEKPPVA